MTHKQVSTDFHDLIYAYYADSKRIFAWRETDNPYYIVISEIMLQQTQTDRVIKKYEEFITAFPTLISLSNTSLDKVIAAWQGLGYNRRALALKQFADRVVDEFDSQVPDDPAVLETFRGIGPATAASICAFAYNMATVFIETNIRSVYIHHFFPGKKVVHDRDLMPLIEATLDKKEPRQWYYALMDYGVMLKKKHKNPSRKSAHHAVQSRFEGSDRQVRGAILKMLVVDPLLSEDVFLESITREPSTIQRILQNLEKEGFIEYKEGCYLLNK